MYMFKDAHAISSVRDHKIHVLRIVSVLVCFFFFGGGGFVLVLCPCESHVSEVQCCVILVLSTVVNVLM